MRAPRHRRRGGTVMRGRPPISPPARGCRSSSPSFHLSAALSIDARGASRRGGRGRKQRASAKSGGHALASRPSLPAGLNSRRAQLPAAQRASLAAGLYSARERRARHKRRSTSSSSAGARREIAGLSRRAAVRSKRGPVYTSREPARQAGSLRVDRHSLAAAAAAAVPASPPAPQSGSSPNSRTAPRKKKKKERNERDGSSCGKRRGKRSQPARPASPARSCIPQ